MNNHLTTGTEKPRPKQKFITFPLWALAYGDSQQQRLTTILQWAIINIGPRVHSKVCRDLPDRMHGLDWTIQKEAVTVPQEFAGYPHECWILATETLLPALKCEPGFTIEACTEGHQKLESFITEMETLCRKQERKPASVHLQLRWVLNCLDGLNGFEPEMPMPYERFAVLSAIYSKIGGTGHGECGWEEIQRRALGYLTEHDMKRCLPCRTDGAKPLSADMIANRVHHLWADEFFARYTPRKGRKRLTSWYGRYGMKDAQLAAIAEANKRNCDRTLAERVMMKQVRNDVLLLKHGQAAA